MAKKITIRGASDDLVIVEGAVHEEFSAYARNEAFFYLGVSDGTLLGISYTRDGVWRINTLRRGTATFTKVDGIPDSDQYSDVVTLEGEVKWVCFGNSYALESKG